jgi:cation transport regulator ChaB
MTMSDQPPVPDPTILTTEQLLRAVASERDYVNGQISILVQRLDAMDKATALLSETVNRVPTVVQTEISHIRGLTDEKFVSIATQFKERDTRSERESRDNKVAVDAAFAAQKEAAAKQDEANAKAINKSELATAETIKTNADLFASQIEAMRATIDDLKIRVTAAESKSTGGKEVVTAIYAFAAFVLVILVVIGIITTAYISSHP